MELMNLYQELLFNRLSRDFQEPFVYSNDTLGQESLDNIGGTEGFRINKIDDNKYNLYWGNQFRPRLSILWKTKDEIIESLKDICTNKATEEYCHLFLRNYENYNYSKS